MPMSVFVLDKGKKPLMPCTGRRARLLLERAVVVRGHPFTIRLKDRVGGDVQPIRVKIDPGGKMTGIALLANEDTNHPATVKSSIELSHRGRQISEALTARRAFRCRRRGANLRCRAPRFDNRRKGEGWSPPGVHVGRVAVRAGGSFTVQTPTAVVQGINARHCKLYSPCRRVQIPTRGRASSAGLRQQSPRRDPMRATQSCEPGGQDGASPTSGRSQA